MTSSIEDDILRSLRRITRAIDLYSRHLAGQFGLTGPQLVCLRTLERSGSSTPSELSRAVDLSQATMTGILDRLETNGLVRRSRDQQDRRRVTVTLTPSGQGLLDRAPSALQESLRDRLGALPESEQRLIAKTLGSVVEMMGAEGLDASALLASGPADANANEVTQLLSSDLEQTPEPESKESP